MKTTLNVTKATGVKLAFSHNKGDEEATIIATAKSGNTLELLVDVEMLVRDGALFCEGKRMPIDEAIRVEVNNFLKTCNNINKGRKKLVFKTMRDFLKSDARKYGNTGDYWEQKDGSIAVYEYESKKELT